jgi:hypothetical protein
LPRQPRSEFAASLPINVSLPSPVSAFSMIVVAEIATLCPPIDAL